MPTTIPHDTLDRFARAVLESLGVPPDDAAIVADCLVWANLSGVDSHGVVRLAHYARRLRNGTIKTRPAIRFSESKPTMLRVDGNDGFGHVVTKRAVERGMEICREHGTATIAIGNSSHFGMAGYYLRDVTHEGLVGMVTTHTDVRIVPPDARAPFAGTNPLAIGFPTTGEPLVLDFATTSVSFGKIALARAEGREIPAEWALDGNGDPTTDPNAVVGMHGIAGYKGAGLAMVIDLFCSIFTGMPFGPHINRMYEELDAPRKLGHFVTLWDVGALVPIADVRERLDQYIAELHALPRRDPGTPVLYPGEPEAKRRADRMASGVPIEPGLLAELRELGESVGVRPDALVG
ncbi:MAG: Ldh family oxidoreductase [Spirochaetota bacterium]